MDNYLAPSLILALGAILGYLVGFSVGHRQGAIDEKNWRDRFRRPPTSSPEHLDPKTND